LDPGTSVLGAQKLATQLDVDLGVDLVGEGDVLGQTFRDLFLILGDDDDLDPARVFVAADVRGGPPGLSSGSLKVFSFTGMRHEAMRVPEPGRWDRD